jgi:hypothetical protein
MIDSSSAILAFKSVSSFITESREREVAVGAGAALVTVGVEAGVDAAGVAAEPDDVTGPDPGSVLAGGSTMAV